MAIPYILSDELRIRRVAAQTIGSGVSTPISWDTEDVDSAGFITVPSTTITIPTNRFGTYAITIASSATVNLGGTRAFIEIAHGATVYRSPWGTTEDSTTNSAIIRLATTDTLLVNIFHTAGANRDFTARLQMFRLGA